MTFAGHRLPNVFACLFFATLLAGSAKAETNVKFLLDWAFQGQQAAFTVPADDGTFQRLGLNVTIDRGVGSGDTVVKVASGTYDIGYADLNAMVRFNDQNPGQRLIAVFIANDAAATGLATKASSSIKSPKDLAGKTLASPQGDASRQLFPLFAKINKLDESSIKWINVSPELRETMLIRDQADAISGDAPTIMLNIRALNIPESDIRVFRFVDYGLELYGKALVVRPEYAAKNPEAIRNFIRGVVHGMNILIKDPDAAVASVKKRDPLIQGDIEKARIKMTLDFAIITPNVLKNGLSNPEIARLDRSLRQVAEGVQLKMVPAVSDVYTDQYLPPRGELKIAQ
jgi:NitT/TauT family transport system substrate-binding protein